MYQVFFSSSALPYGIGDHFSVLLSISHAMYQVLFIK